MLGYGLWHQSCGWPWETCTGDDCQDSRWKKFGLMHGCASPSLFCSVFIWRGGFAPSLRCNGTVFLVYLKCFLTVVLEQGRHGEGMPLCSYEACGIALIFQMHSNADNMLFWVRQSYWLQMHANAVSSLQSYLQCHIYTQFILNHHDCLKLEYGDVSHMTIYHWCFRRFRTPELSCGKVPKRRGMKQGALERQYCLWWMQLTWQWFWTLGPAMEHKTSSNRQLGRTQHSPTFLKPIFWLTASI